MGKKHPHLQEEIQVTFELMLYEIEEGGSITHEIDLAMQHIEDVNYLQKFANALADKYGFKPPYNQKEIINIIDHHEPGIITINAVDFFEVYR